MSGLPWTIPGGQQVQFTPHVISGRNGGDAVVIGTGAIRSENFVTDASGWRITGEGNAEFNDITVRGRFETGTSGARAVIGDDGVGSSYILLYNGDASEEDPAFIYNDFGTTTGFLQLYAPQHDSLTTPPRISLAQDTSGNNYFQMHDCDLVTIFDDARLEIGDGTAASPAIRFKGDTNTGVYWIGSNEIGLTAGGVKRASFSSTVASSFTAPGTDTPTMSSSWTNTDLQVHKDFSGFVHIHGYVRNENGGVASTGVYDPILTVSTGYRPAAAKRYITRNNSNVMVTYDITTSGTVDIISGTIGDTEYLPLQCSYYVGW